MVIWGMVSGIVLTTLVAFLIQLSLNQTGSVPISQDGSVFFSVAEQLFPRYLVES